MQPPKTLRVAFALLLHVLTVAITITATRAKFLPDSVVCPRYFSTPGDTLESVSMIANADPSAVALSIEACGGRVNPISLGMLCLPGGEYEACRNVKNFRNNPKCAYYVVQAGDTASSIASSLSLYLPAIESTNAGAVKLDQLNPGEVLKLPPWDVSCGVSLPKTDAEVQSLAPAPPPPALVSAGGVGGGASANTECVAYRAQAWDTMFTVAASFSIPIGRLMEINPDYSNGKVVTTGAIVILENPAGKDVPCVSYTFKEGYGEIEATATQVPPSPPPPPPGPIQLGVVSSENPQIFNQNATLASPDDDVLDYELRAEEDEMGGGTHNGRPIISNIVTDKTEATQAPSGSGPNVGIWIMIACLSVVVLLVLGLVSVAISNSIKKLGNSQNERKAPPERGVGSRRSVGTGSSRGSRGEEGSQGSDDEKSVTTTSIESSPKTSPVKTTELDPDEYV